MSRAADLRAPRCLERRRVGCVFAVALALALADSAAAEPRASRDAVASAAGVQRSPAKDARRAQLKVQLEQARARRGGLLLDLVTLRERVAEEERAKATDLSYLLDPRIAPPTPEERDPPVEAFVEDLESQERNWTDQLVLIVRRLDADRDGVPEQVRFIDPDTHVMIRKHLDRNGDGAMDAWHSYKRRRLVGRMLDSDFNGSADTVERYRSGYLSHREVDRDGDGTIDGFYDFRGDSLVEERHDRNNDGVPDRIVTYRDRMRETESSDRNGDGEIDTWVRYRVVDGKELVASIERDAKGRGRADTFETFEIQAGRPVLAERREDVNGDGSIDVSSIYRRGRLVRREILDAEAANL